VSETGAIMYYYAHPESECIWCQEEELDLDETDGNVIEISCEEYDELEAKGYSTGVAR